MSALPSKAKSLQNSAAILRVDTHAAPRHLASAVDRLIRILIKRFIRSRKTENTGARIGPSDGGQGWRVAYAKLGGSNVDGRQIRNDSAKFGEVIDTRAGGNTFAEFCRSDSYAARTGKKLDPTPNLADGRGRPIEIVAKVGSDFNVDTPRSQQGRRTDLSPNLEKVNPGARTDIYQNSDRWSKATLPELARSWDPGPDLAQGNGRTNPQLVPNLAEAEPSTLEKNWRESPAFAEFCKG